MKADQTKRLWGALAGCALALASCLVAPAGQRHMDRQAMFRLPHTIGSWNLIQEGSLEANELKILQANDHFRGVYECQTTQRLVVVTTIAGAGGPMVSHQPALCYARNDYWEHSASWLWTVPNRNDELRFQTFEPRQVERQALTMAYAWHDGAHWKSPSVPRFQLAGHAALQRLQITVWHPPGLELEAQTTIQQFTKLAVEEMQTEREGEAPAEPVSDAGNGRVRLLPN